MLIDTHCHLTHERFSSDLSETLDRARDAGVAGVVAIASDLDDAVAIGDLCSSVSRPFVRGTVGIHPHEAEEAPSDLRERLIAGAGEPWVVALGECGLDYHYDFSPRDRQRAVLDAHIEAAQESGLPLVVHCRDAEEDMRSVVRRAGEAGVQGVLHCFLGDDDLLDVALGSGWLVSFTGIVTFGSFGGAGAVARVPEDRYMIETDGPYLAPVPHRGKRNEPAWVAEVCARVADLRDETPEEVARRTTENAVRFFGLERAASGAP